MAELSALNPIKSLRLIDLLRSAGVSVNDWKNFKGGLKKEASNPKYCYRWSFIEPQKLVVLNLWIGDMSEQNGVISQTSNMRTFAALYGNMPHKSVWKRRALDMDLAIQTALENELPVRVVICNGKTWDLNEDTQKASQVKKRLLDSEPWSVTDYDWYGGEFTVTRGVQDEKLTTEELEIRFHMKTLEVYEAAKEVCGYNATRFLQKVRKVGGLAAAQNWLDPQRGFAPTNGFLKLVEVGRLDISLEALVMREPWRCLFNQSELEVAKERLRIYGYTGVKPTAAVTTRIGTGTFKPKSDKEYFAYINGGVQKRYRNHETLVKAAAEFFSQLGAAVSNPHPIDLLMSSPLKIIFEAKLVTKNSAVFAIREAVGQLFEYRYLLGPNDGKLCIILDQEPDGLFVTYLEKILQFLIIWQKGSNFVGGPQTRKLLSRSGIVIV